MTVESTTAHLSDAIESTMKAVWRAKDKIEKTVEDTCSTKVGNMDIAGLMALMQSNKSMDLPGLLALCKDKGYENQFGGQGMFMFVFLLLFLFQGRGFGNLSGTDQAAFTAAAGNNCQEIIGIHDRISAAQAAATDGARDTQNIVLQGFQGLDAKICSAIAEVIATVRNQGDRVYDSVQNVSRQISECCCALTAKLDLVLCQITGLKDSMTANTDRVIANDNANTSKLESRIRELEQSMSLGFERTACLIKDTAKDQELNALREFKSAAVNKHLIDEATQTATRTMQAFNVAHFPLKSS